MRECWVRWRKERIRVLENHLCYVIRQRKAYYTVERHSLIHEKSREFSEDEEKSEFFQKNTRNQPIHPSCTTLKPSTSHEGLPHSLSLQVARSLGRIFFSCLAGRVSSRQRKTFHFTEGRNLWENFRFLTHTINEDVFPFLRFFSSP